VSNFIKVLSKGAELFHADRRTDMGKLDLFFNYQLNAQFLFSITIYMLHYNPRHVSSSAMLIFRR